MTPDVQRILDRHANPDFMQKARQHEQAFDTYRKGTCVLLLDHTSQEVLHTGPCYNLPTHLLVVRAARNSLPNMSDTMGGKFGNPI